MNKRLLLTICTFAFGFAIFNIVSNKKVEAATCTWVGGSGINWSTAANWDGECSGAGGIPADGDSVNFDNTGVKPLSNNDLGLLELIDINITDIYDVFGDDISISNSITCSDNYSFENDVTLTNTVTFKDCNFGGAIDLNGNILNLQQSISHWGFNGFIDGNGTISTGVGSWVDLLGGAGNGTITINLTTSTMSLDGGGWDNTTVNLSNGGVFYGSGQNIAEVVSDGSFSNIISPSYPGAANPTPQIMNIGGFNLQNSNDQIRIVLAGTNSNEFDQIHAMGGAIFPNATFYLFQNDGYTPTIGSTFQIITANVLFGVFDGLPDGSIINLNRAARYQINYGGTDVTLTVVSGYCTWNGSVDNLWSTPGNWDPGCSGPGGIPDHGDRLTFNGSSNIETINDIGELNLYGIDFLAPGFEIHGSQLDMFQPILATNQADIYANVWMRTPTMGDHNYYGNLELDDQIGTVTINLTRDIVVNGDLAGCYPSMHLIFNGPHRVTMSGTGGFYCMDVATQGGGELFVNGNYSSIRFIASSGSTLSGNGSVSNVTINNTGRLYPVDIAGNPTTFNIDGDLNLIAGSLLEFVARGLTPGIEYSQIVSSGNINNPENATVSFNITPFSSTQADTIVFLHSTGLASEFVGFESGTVVDFGDNMVAFYFNNEFGFAGAAAGVTPDPTLSPTGINLSLHLIGLSIVFGLSGLVLNKRKFA